MRHSRLQPSPLVVPEQTWGLAEAHLTFPVGWASEEHPGSTRVAVELFGRGTIDRPSEEIRRELQALSCSIDASTSAFQTRVSLHAHEDKILETVDLALELMGRFTAAPDEMERVMSRLDSENRSVREDPDLIADLALRRALWPRGREAFGAAGRLAERHALSGAQVMQRWREATDSSPLVLGCATDEQLMQEAISQLVEQTAAPRGPSSYRPTAGATPARDAVMHVPNATGAECLRIARVLPTLGERERAIIELLNFALVGGFMGTLYQTLRTELHLVYAVSTHVSYTADYTLWVTEVSPSPGHGGDVLEALPGAIETLRDQLSDEGFDELIARFVAHHVHRVSSWRGRFQAIRSDLEQGRPATERRRLPERVATLSRQEVIAFLDRWHHAARPRVVVHVGDTPPASHDWDRTEITALAPGL